MGLDEEQHYQEVREERQRRLWAVDKQIEQFGPYAPPYMLVERARLQQELGIVEKVIAAPASADIMDELGERGRSLYYHEQLRQLDKKVADLVSLVLPFIERSMEWRRTMRQWIIWIGFGVFVLSLLFVAVITYLATKGD